MSVKLVPAMRNFFTKEVYTGTKRHKHLWKQVPEPRDNRYEQGFVRQDTGEFITREEAAVLVGKSELGLLTSDDIWNDDDYDSYGS